MTDNTAILKRIRNDVSGVIADVTLGNGFDDVCLHTLERVEQALNELSNNQPTTNYNEDIRIKNS